MSTTVDIGTLFERSPEIRKGRPRIAGAGVTVRRIAGWQNLGLTPEEIAAKIEHLSLAQIHAALAYYHANRDEIDAGIAAEEAAIERIFPVPAEPWTGILCAASQPVVGRVGNPRPIGNRPCEPAGSVVDAGDSGAVWKLDRGRINGMDQYPHAKRAD